MLGPTEFRDLVSGRRTDAGARALRGLLRTAEVPYSLAVAYRNRRFDRGLSHIQRVDVPVISVGNLTLGGTGKTPMVKWIARSLRQRALRVAIVSRGYGARAGHENDEAHELRTALPDVAQVQDPDRVAGARRAIHQGGAQVIVLDDGFQHRRLARDLDIVLLDALEPFGFDHVFPRGTLREPVDGLRRAHVVCLSRADTLDPSQRDTIRRRAQALAPQAIWCELAHAACRLINASGESQSLATLAGRRVAAFCGIGNPAAFQHTLAGLGCQLVAWRAFPDHHNFDQADFAAVQRLAADSRAELLLCTHKDLVKLQSLAGTEIPLWAVVVEMQFLAGLDAFQSTLDRVIGHNESDSA